MSDVGRYRRAYPRLYRHPEYRKLTRIDKELAQYVLFGPQSNRIGIAYFSVNVAAEDLDASVQSIRRGLRDVPLPW
jgi:hypothetical protein